MTTENPWRPIAQRGPATLWTKLNSRGKAVYHATMNNIFFTENKSIVSLPVAPARNKFSLYSTPRSAWARYDREQERGDEKERLRNAQESNI